MSCALTQGYTLDCKDSIGGIRSVRVIEWDYLYTSSGLTTITASSGNISAISPTSSKKFWKYELAPRNKDFAKESWQSNNENGTLFWDQEVQITIRKMSASLRNEIRLLAQNRLAMIIETNNVDSSGNYIYWLYGEKSGLELEPSEATTGSAKGDFNGYVLKFKGMEAAPAQTVDINIIAGLTN